jgi:hypothetical protein
LVKDEEEKSQGQRDETAAAGVNYGDGLRSKITLGLDEARLTRPVISLYRPEFDGATYRPWAFQLHAVWAFAIVYVAEEIFLFLPCTRNIEILEFLVPQN